MKRITSRQNAVVGEYRSVARGTDKGRMLLDGAHLVGDALAAGIPLDHAMVSADAAGRPELRAIVAQLERSHVEVVEASPSVMAAVSPVRSASAIVAIGVRPSPPEHRLYESTSPLLVVTCDVQEPGNLGAIVRVAEAVGASGLVAAGRSADPFGWKALRGSMGSGLRLPIAIRPQPHDVLTEARRHHCRVVATAPRGGRSPVDADLRGAIAVLVGGEGPGLPASLLEAADEVVTIPMREPVESLNAAVAAAVILYEAHRQRR